MIMRSKKEGTTLVFHLEGQLDFETTRQFEEMTGTLLSSTDNTRVVFNLERLKFVGSSGINHFIRILKEFNSSGEKPRYCNLSSEFERIFRAYQTTRNPFEIHETECLAIASFDAPRPAPKPRRTKKSS